MIGHVFGWFGGAPEAHDFFHFVVGEVGALDTHGTGRICGSKEHITTSEQLFGTGLVKDNA